MQSIRQSTTSITKLVRKESVERVKLIKKEEKIPKPKYSSNQLNLKSEQKLIKNHSTNKLLNIKKHNKELVPSTRGIRSLETCMPIVTIILHDNRKKEKFNMLTE